MAVGSPLGQTLPNIFLGRHEKIWLQNFPSDYKSSYFKRILFFNFNFVNLRVLMIKKKKRLREKQGVVIITLNDFFKKDK